MSLACRILLHVEVVMNHVKTVRIGKKQLLVWVALVLTLALPILGSTHHSAAIQVADGGGVKTGTGG